MIEFVSKNYSYFIIVLFGLSILFHILSKFFGKADYNGEKRPITVLEILKFISWNLATPFCFICALKENSLFFFFLTFIILIGSVILMYFFGVLRGIQISEEIDEEVKRELEEEYEETLKKD